jgi:hypothetical protein
MSTAIAPASIAVLVPDSIIATPVYSEQDSKEDSATRKEKKRAKCEQTV